MCVCVCVCVCVCACVRVCVYAWCLSVVSEFVRWFFNEKVRKVDMKKFVFICVFLIIVNQAYLHFCLRSKVILTAKP